MTGTTGQEPAPAAVLIHPLEIPAARRAYLAATALALLSSPVLLVAVMFLLWSVSDNPATPVLAPAWTLVLASLGERRYRSEAWAHIPRRRQDGARHDPAALSAVAAGVPPLCLAAAGWTFVQALETHPVAAAAAPLAAGAAAALAGVLLAVMAWDRAASPAHRISRCPRGLATAAGTGALLILAAVFGALAGSALPDLPPMAVGGGAVLAASAVWGVFQLIPGRIPCLPGGFLSR